MAWLLNDSSFVQTSWTDLERLAARATNQLTIPTALASDHHTSHHCLSSLHLSSSIIHRHSFFPCSSSSFSSSTSTRSEKERFTSSSRPFRYSHTRTRTRERARTRITREAERPTLHPPLRLRTLRRTLSNKQFDIDNGTLVFVQVGGRDSQEASENARRDSCVARQAQTRWRGKGVGTFRRLDAVRGWLLRQSPSRLSGHDRARSTAWRTLVPIVPVLARRRRRRRT